MGVVVEFPLRRTVRNVQRADPKQCESCGIPMNPAASDPLCGQCRGYVRMYEGLPGRGPGGDAA